MIELKFKKKINEIKFGINYSLLINKLLSFDQEIFNETTKRNTKNI